MDDTQRIVKCGNLSLHTPGGFFKKRWPLKYLVLYDGSKSGIKRLELFDSEMKFKKQNPAKIIPLVDCIRVVTCQRNKTTYTFEVRTNEQFYLLAAQTFQDMNDWVNCVRLVAFGQSSTHSSTVGQTSADTQVQSMGANQKRTVGPAANVSLGVQPKFGDDVDVLLGKRPVAKQQVAPGISSPIQVTPTSPKPITPMVDTAKSSPEIPPDYSRSRNQSPMATSAASNGHIFNLSAKSDSNSDTQRQISRQIPQSESSAIAKDSRQVPVTTASQAAAAAASALAKTRQRQPSLLGSCKPQPPQDSPFIQSAPQTGPVSAVLSAIGQVDTMTPTVRGQLINSIGMANSSNSADKSQPLRPSMAARQKVQQPTLDEEEENMLYCSIEDNPAEHNYRVKVIETELSLRCQLKCYQLTAPTTISQQYESLGQINSKTGAYDHNQFLEHQPPGQVTFYQLIIGPQELTLLNDYAAFASRQQQGLWSWPYQCIRRYGFDKDNCFMFEAGRKCTSGPGQFIVQTPKAYSIYQDVVKFVNELRSLNSNDMPANGSPPPPMTQKPLCDPLGEQQNTIKSAKSITQIPVTWEPSNASLKASSELSKSAACRLGEVEIPNLDSNSRQQFFDTLRQMDICSQPMKQHEIVTSCVVPRGGHNKEVVPQANIQIEAQVSTASISAKELILTNEAKHNIQLIQSKKVIDGIRKSDVTSEETDESGYEYGDDSVDSSSSKFKTHNTGVGRKRQLTDSITSSNSSSSSSGEGSPGHSVSRRSDGRVASRCKMSNSQAPPKRTPIGVDMLPKKDPVNLAPKDTKKVFPNNNGISLGLHDLITDSVLGPEDFETNLIRDVYSEITKLHAKFAVTSNGSADDSMSGSDTGSNDCSVSESSDQRDDRPDLREPMYSNVSSSPPPEEGRRQLRANHFDQHSSKDALKARGVSSLGDGRYQNNPCEQIPDLQRPYIPNHITHEFNQGSRLSHPMYPTMLNPIPECGEPNIQAQVQRTPSKLQQLTNKTVECRPQGSNSGPMSNLRHKVSGSGVANNTNGKQFQYGKSRLATNHYVINDVQYAKISRGSHPKFDSCL